MHERGELYNRHRAGQLIDFRGLKFNKITPTDIDGFIDFGNELFVVLEYKCGDAPMPYGQKLALERYAKSARVKCYVLVGEHNNNAEDIDGAGSVVREFYNGVNWHIPQSALTVKQAIDILLVKQGINID